MRVLMIFTACTLSAPALKDKPFPIGEWVVLNAGRHGELVGVRVTIDAERLTFWGDRQNDSFPITFAAKDGASQIDLWSEPDRLALTGIYKVEGDRLILCINESEKLPRPTEFEEAKEVALIALKKISK